MSVNKIVHSTCVGPLLHIAYPSSLKCIQLKWILLLELNIRCLINLQTTCEYTVNKPNHALLTCPTHREEAPSCQSKRSSIRKPVAAQRRSVLDEGTHMRLIRGPASRLHRSGHLHRICIAIRKRKITNLVWKASCMLPICPSLFILLALTPP